MQSGTIHAIVLSSLAVGSWFTPAAAQPIWVDLQSFNILEQSSPDITGQQWCDSEFAVNLGGLWECVEGTGSYCIDPVPADTEVWCGRLNDDGTTPYLANGRLIEPFGYGRIERHLVTRSTPGRTGEWWCDQHFGANLTGFWKCRGVSGLGECEETVSNQELVSCSQYADVRTVSVRDLSATNRTGQWWCDNHFAANLAGDWDCLDVEPGQCNLDAENWATVTCGRYSEVDESPFEPPACDDPSLDSVESTFCRHTDYMRTREASTYYLFNDYLRAGFNRNYGGALFELYGRDARNRIEEHGGAAMQLSLWGVAANSTGVAWFTTSSCDPTPYPDPDTCLVVNDGLPCARGPATGDHISDCVTEYPCTGWGASAPWNPMQALSTGCCWCNDTHHIDEVRSRHSALSLTKHNPCNYTKSSVFEGLTWTITGRLGPDSPFLVFQYAFENGSVHEGREHNQEIPAIFADNRINHWYYYYAGNSPYQSISEPVTRARWQFDTYLKLPGKEEPIPIPTPPAYHETGEDWMSLCDRTETQCLTVATFMPQAKAIAMKEHYITVLGRFALEKNLSVEGRVYIFPYRFDAIVAGRSVREWIYLLKIMHDL